MRNNIRAAASCFLVLLAWAVSAPVGAVSVSFLGIEGELGPGGAGTYPLDAEFSWISHRFPGSENAHIWTLAPGTDGGLFIGMAQPGRGQITASRPMYNLASWLYSVEDGAHFDEESETFDLASLRLSWGESIYDFGFGGGVSAMVPLVGAMEDVLSMNGWWVGEAGNYHLVFRGDGQCDGCELTVHLTGQMSAVPLPAAVWLLGSGLLVLIPYRKPEHSRTQ